MTPVDAVAAIEESRKLSVQSKQSAGLGNVFLVNWMSSGNQTIAPWWSPGRDNQLRNFWKTSDHLSGAVYTMTSKMTAIPNKVVARDTSVKAYVEQAKRVSEILQEGSEFGEGWVTFYSKWVEDLLTQDNGAFAEVIGRGDPTGPILGQPVGVAHLDSWRCTRTGDPIFPVIYTDVDGKRYKLHYSRVIFASQMTSPIAEMFGVGLCAVSRALNVSQTLIDILRYKQEKLGSRPHRAIMITQGGLDPNDLASAMSLASADLDSKGLGIYSEVVIGGSSTLPEADAKVIELSGLPDGFDEQTAITLGMATIALAFGVDARELFPAMSSGATRADALLQHLKQRGKGPGQILQVTEQLFNFKFLPPHLRFEFDFQDDAQDRQVAEIRQIRALRRVQDLTTNALSKRVLREQMFEDGDINEAQFDRMELEDGRLPDGTSVLALFTVKSGEISRLLDIGLSDPLDIYKNDPEKVHKKVYQKMKDVLQIRVSATSPESRWVAEEAYSALKYLDLLYNPQGEAVWAVWDGKPPAGPAPAAPGGGGGNGTYIDPRLRTIDLTNPEVDPTQNTNNDTSTRTHPDDQTA